MSEETIELNLMEAVRVTGGSVTIIPQAFVKMLAEHVPMAGILDDLDDHPILSLVIRGETSIADEQGNVLPEPVKGLLSTMWHLGQLAAFVVQIEKTLMTAQLHTSWIRHLDYARAQARTVGPQGGVVSVDPGPEPSQGFAGYL